MASFRLLSFFSSPEERPKSAQGAPNTVPGQPTNEAPHSNFFGPEHIQSTENSASRQTAHEPVDRVLIPRGALGEVGARSGHVGVV